MPIYTYKCDSEKCGRVYDHLFSTISKASEFVDQHQCECGNKSTRVYDGPPKAFFKFSDRPMYSSNFDPKK